jgi:hypothetical protein
MPRIWSGYGYGYGCGRSDRGRWCCRPLEWLEARGDHPGEILGNHALLVCWGLQEVTLIPTSKSLSIKDVSSFGEKD